jgi:hypothetical protein
MSDAAFLCPTREETIQALRSRLTPLTGAEQSLCRVAAERGIFCRGFRRWQVAEFYRRWRPAIGVSTHLSRAQMERYADLWQLTEQLCRGVSLACDANCGDDGAPCRGWDEFSDEELARFCRELDRQSMSPKGDDDHGKPDPLRN